MEKDLVEISKDVLKHISEIDNIVDNYFEPIKDITDTAQDIFTPIKIVHSLYTFNKKRKFKSFLKSYAKSLDEGGINTPEKTIHMYSYLENERNFNFVNDTIDSSLNSKSIYCSMILGYFAGRVLSHTINITLKELLIVSALKDLNDYELSYFTKIYSIADLSKVVNIYDYKKEITNTYLFEITISKLIQLRVVEEAPILASGKPKGSFISSEIAEDIYFMIKDMNIEKELLNYEL
ncbi:hypothetical protein [uncultured Marixanthomonas sp.]|uniref:hypothetical protein n=1 Tax=uncultured Marixanthomonas sp. TaxID=757245 RepID=UPI0030D8680A|tara:strand:- start:121 stop:828 length:708 start_codon:yes stop_codon:yes gene_type:complete